MAGSRAASRQSVIPLLQTADPNILHKTADPLSDGTEPRILFRNRRANRGSLSTETGSPYQTADPSKPRILLPNELNRGSWIRGIRGNRGSNDTLPGMSKRRKNVMSLLVLTLTFGPGTDTRATNFNHLRTRRGMSL